MIKILASTQTLDQLKEAHWMWLNKKLFRKISGKTKAHQIKEILRLKCEDEIEKIVKADYQDMQKYIDQWGDYRTKKDGDDLQKLFCFDAFSKEKSQKWSAYKLCSQLKITVCPYCNRQYIFTIGSAKSKCVRPEIDHFFPKDRYPYLSCSFYNLIPSCSLCNKLKGDTDTKATPQMIYPYLEEFGDKGIFQMKAATDILAEKIANLSVDDIGIFIKCTGLEKQKIERSKQVFGLEKLYLKHRIELIDLLTRFQTYPLSNCESIAKTLRLPPEFVYNTVMGLPLNTPDELEYPLKKFKHDIIQQLESNRKIQV